MRIRFPILPVLLGLLCLPLWSEAQTRRTQRFQAGIVAGFTASQIDGDNSAGYNKLGLTAGVRGVARLKKRTEASVEILFAQRGSQSELVRDELNPFNFSLTLNYIEVPVLFHYKDWFVEDDEDGFYRVSVNTGLSYARFMNHNLRDEGFSGLGVVLPDYLKKDDISFLLGANFFANRHVGFSFRYVRSLGAMYDPGDWDPSPYRNAWRGHCLYFQGVYLF